MNWLDWTIVAFLGASVIAGFREGFIRLGIGMLALLTGFIVASWFYGMAADPLLPYVHHRMVANLIGFMLILSAVVAAGALIAALLVRMFHLVGLSIVDRTLGAALGAGRGMFVLVVVTMAVMAFAPRRLPAAVDSSRLAPYVLRAARVASAATPYEVKSGVDETIARIGKAFRKPKQFIEEHK